MAESEVLRTLFEVHHHQLEERRQRIHGITQRTVGAFMVTAGWLLSIKVTGSVLLPCLVSIAVIAVAATASRIVWGHNSTYLRICAVVGQLNKALGLFEQGKYLEGQALYPEEWKHFGSKSRLATIWHHLLVINLMAIVCICAAFLRQRPS